MQISFVFLLPVFRVLEYLAKIYFQVLDKEIAHLHQTILESNTAADMSVLLKLPCLTVLSANKRQDNLPLQRRLWAQYRQG